MKRKQKAKAVDNRKEKTLHSTLPSAFICRRNKWQRGTLLYRQEGRRYIVICITAVGDNDILARPVSDGGKSVIDDWERIWTLCGKDWMELIQ